MNKNKEKVRDQYIIDHFVDFTGENREFVICALSKENYIEQLEFDLESKPITTISKGTVFTYKEICFGIAVRNYGDTFSEERGQKIAKGYAYSKPFEIITANRKFSINVDTVTAFLKSYAEFFKQDPGMFIPSYRQHKEDYIKNPEKYLANRKFLLEKEKEVAKLEKELKTKKAEVFKPTKESKGLKNNAI